MTEISGSVNRNIGLGALNSLNPSNNIQENTFNSENKVSGQPMPVQEEQNIPEEIENQLNRLLGRAASKTFSNFTQESLDLEKILSKKSLKYVMRSEKLPNGQKGVLEQFKTTQNLMKELDKLNTMVDNAKLFEKQPGTKNLPLHIQAMNAQMDLADSLRVILNRMKGPELTEKEVDFLEEMQFACNARAAEISRWAGQMKELYEAQKNPAPQKNALQYPKTSDNFAFDTKVSDALAVLSGKMHGTADGLLELASSNQHVYQFLQTLAEFQKSQEKGEVSQEEYNKLQHDALELQHALEDIQKNGLSVTRQSAQDGLETKQVTSTGWRLDPATLKQIVSDLEKSLNPESQRKEALLKVAQRIIHAELGLPPCLLTLKEIPEEIIQKYAPGCDLSALFKAQDTIEQILMDFAHEPTHSKRTLTETKLLKDVLSSIPYKNLRQSLKVLGDNINEWVRETKVFFGLYDPAKWTESKEQFQNDLIALQMMDWYNLDTNKELTFLQNDGEFYKQKISAVLDFLEKMDEGDKLDGLKTKPFLASVFHGEYSVSSLIETRLHNVEDEDIQMETENSKLVSAIPLGEGIANQVFLCEYSDGSTFVFKPELPSEHGLHRLMLGHGAAYSQKTQVYKLNIATQKCAEAFGLEGSIVTAKAGVLNGQFGFFMSKASGKTIENLTSSSHKSQMQQRIEQKNNKEQLQKNMFFQFNELQWLDLLTGQGDRHKENLMMDISNDPDDTQVSLKGIDNDMCFSENRTGTFTFLISSNQYKLAKSTATQYKKSFSQDAVDEGNKNWDKCFIQQPNGTYLADVGKMQEMNNPYLILIAHQAIGLHSCSLPSYISRDLYNKLQEMKDEKNIQKLIDSLGKHLSTTAIHNMLCRLSELTEYADQLAKNNKVIDRDGDNWKNLFEEAQKQHKLKMDSLSPKCLDQRNNPRSFMTVDYYFKFIENNGLFPQP